MSSLLWSDRRYKCSTTLRKTCKQNHAGKSRINKWSTMDEKDKRKYDSHPTRQQTIYKCLFNTCCFIFKSLLLLKFHLIPELSYLYCINRFLKQESKNIIVGHVVVATDLLFGNDREISKKKIVANQWHINSSELSLFSVNKWKLTIKHCLTEVKRRLLLRRGLAYTIYPHLHTDNKPRRQINPPTTRCDKTTEDRSWSNPKHAEKWQITNTSRIATLFDKQALFSQRTWNGMSQERRKKKPLCV